jgi:hypothetical protein
MLYVSVETEFKAPIVFCRAHGDKIEENTTNQQSDVSIGCPYLGPSDETLTLGTEEINGGSDWIFFLKCTTSIKSLVSDSLLCLQESR